MYRKSLKQMHSVVLTLCTVCFLISIGKILESVFANNF